MPIDQFKNYRCLKSAIRQLTKTTQNAEIADMKPLDQPAASPLHTYKIPTPSQVSHNHPNISIQRITIIYPHVGPIARRCRSGLLKYKVHNCQRNHLFLLTVSQLPLQCHSAKHSKKRQTLGTNNSCTHKT